MSYKDPSLRKVSNPPFKPFIDYRIGDYNTFRKVMLGLIKKNTLLSEALSFRKSDKKDYGAALVDMWAYLCDILTYYQERRGSESFIRTATLEESVIELLYLVDSLPRGRSASALVRFVANEKNVPPNGSSVIIPKGFKIRSVPAKGQEAIIFETDESLAVYPDHNLMKLDGWRTSFKIERGTTQLFLDKVYPELTIGDLIMINDDKSIDVIRIGSKVDKDGKSQIGWSKDEPLSSDYDLSKTKIQKFTQVVRPFGYNAPPSILSNVGVAIYAKNLSTPSDDGNKDSDHNDVAPGEKLKPVLERLVQLVDASDRVIASTSSDNAGTVTFNGLIPGSYKIMIARSGKLKDEGELNPITTISTNRFQLLPGIESWFDAELELRAGEQPEFFVNTLKAISRSAQENLPQERALTAPVFNNPFLPKILEKLANDTQSDMRSGLNLIPKETYPLDPVSEDNLSSTVYLDKVYRDIKDESFVVLSYDPSLPIDISRHLFKISNPRQRFYAKYGIGGAATKIKLQSIEGKDDEKQIIFCWEEILQEIKEAQENKDHGSEGGEQGVKGLGKETKKLLDFLKNDMNTLDSEKDRPTIIDNGTAIEISDQDGNDVYRIELKRMDGGKAAALLEKNGKKVFDFTVEGGGGREENQKTNLYASNIESSFYKIRNTLIFTNPVMEIGVDPRYASQYTIDEHTENITLEGIHMGLKAGDFLGITDNTSMIQTKVVDSTNLHPLEGYRVSVCRIQKLEPSSPSPSSSSSSSVSIHAAPVEVTSGQMDAEGAFRFDDLRTDTYVLALSLSIEKYWAIFVDHIFEEVAAKKNNNNTHVRNNGNNEGNEKRQVINALLSSLQRKDREVTKSSIKSKRDSTKKINHEYKHVELAKQHLNAFHKLVALIGRRGLETLPSNLEGRVAAYITEIVNVVSEVQASIMRLSNAESDQTTTTTSSSSSPPPPSSTSLLDGSTGENIKLIEQGPEPKLKQLKSKVQEVLDRLPDERSDASISYLREFIENTIMPMAPILEEILIIVKESLQSPFRSTIYQQNERLLGVTKALNLEADTATNVTMTFSIRDKLTYFESKLQQSKFQVTRVAGSPIFSEGKTNLSLNPPLSYSYVKGFAEIYGNIVPASHGETVKDEILGSGDASTIHQEFTLSKGPISHVPSPLSPSGMKSTLKVIVNDIQWQEKDNFLNSGPNDQHYVTSLNENGSIRITFGDGTRGSTLPTGVDNVHAQYRIGIGSKGNLQPNAFVVPQVNNPAIKSVSIPAGSYGGIDKVLSQQKRNYRPYILTLGRAVSLEDYSSLATTFGGISKARAYLITRGGRETVILIVAGQKGIVVSSALQMELQTYMDERRDVSVPLEIESFVPVPVDIVVEVKVNDSYRRSRVTSSILTSLGPGTHSNAYHNSGGEEEDTYLKNSGRRISNSIGIHDGNQRLRLHHSRTLFSFERLNFGQKVTLNEVYAITENIPGVDFAVVRKFCRRDAAITNEVQEVINANHNEILQCDNDPLDPIRGTIKVIARGGI